MLWSEVAQQQMRLQVAQGQATSVVLAQQGPPKEGGTHIVALTCDHPPPAPGPMVSPQQLASDEPGLALSTMDFVRKSASSYVF